MAGASATNVTRAQQQSKPIDGKPITVFCVVGPTERGPVFEHTQILSFPDYERIFGGPTLATAETYLQVKSVFDEAAPAGVTIEMSRLVHSVTPGDPVTKTSAAAQLILATSAVSATSGQATSGAGPFALDHGVTLVLAIDAGGDQTFTISATQASRTTANTGTYTLANGQTIQIAINGGSTFTKAFATSEFSDIAAATPAEVVAALNAFFALNEIPATASVATNAVKISANRKGTGSIVNVVAGTAVGASPLLQFTTGASAGTGNVANAAAVTAAEWVTIMAGLTGAVPTAVSGALRASSSTTGGSSSVQVKSASTADLLMGFDNAVHTGFAAGTQGTWQIDGKSDGAYANGLSHQIVAASNGDANARDLRVLKAGVAIERLINLDGDPTSPNYFVTVINSGSKGQGPSNLIAATDLESTLPSPDNLPALGTFGPMTGGDDGLVGLADTDWTGGVSTNGRTGFRCFDVVAPGFGLLSPGRATAAVHNGMISYCEGVRKGLCFAFLDTPANMTGAQMVTYVTITAALKQLSEQAEINWPRVKVDNPNKGVFGEDATIVCGPSGMYAGLCARLDQSKIGGAFEQPASKEKGFLRTCRGLETDEVQDEGVRGIVFDALINPIMTGIGTPPWVDGERTLRDDGPFPTVGESRGVLFVQVSVKDALDPKRNQNLRPRFYREAKDRVTDFLSLLTKNECFGSNVDSEAWFFDIGKGLNSPSEKKARRANARLSLFTVGGAEMINVEIAPFTQAA